MYGLFMAASFIVVVGGVLPFALRCLSCWPGLDARDLYLLQQPGVHHLVGGVALSCLLVAFFLAVSANVIFDLTGLVFRAWKSKKETSAEMVKSEMVK